MKHKRENGLGRNEGGFTFILAVLLVVVLAGVAIAGYVTYSTYRDSVAQSETTPKPTPSPAATVDAATAKEAVSKTADPFGQHGDFGAFRAEGYATTTKVQGQDYVFFKITKTTNTAVLDYIKKISGNSFVGDQSIGLGCLAGGKITYSNDSDNEPGYAGTIDTSDTTAIMAATAQWPVALEVNKFEYTGGRGAPTCTSLFSTFKVVN